MKRASLNHVYRLVWSEIHNAWVAVCETGRGRGKSAGGRRMQAVLGVAALLGTGLAGVAQAGQALPTGGKITSGSGRISQSGSAMTIDQSTGNLSINWQGFSIGQGNTVQFVQPSSSSVAVNRVVGSDVSNIQGSLKANGQVFLSNPNGVLFSPTAQVDVGGLVATTHSITQNGDGTYTLRGTSGASVTNQGSINAAGGTVAMVAARIENTGSIAAPGGNVMLGAGDKVTLDLGGPVKLSVDKGSVNALIEQGGLIQANGGQVLIAAKNLGSVTQTVINQTGVIEAQTLSTGKTGEITLAGDMSHGQINVGGTLDASAPVGGSGGHIETDAAQVKIAPGARVTTQAVHGKTGDWVIDPTNFTIQAGSGTLKANSIGVDTLQTMLGNTNVTLTTSTAKNGSDLGDITVQDVVAWSAHSLTLNAAHDINVNAQMSVGQASTDNAGLVMNAANNINVGTDAGGTGSIVAAGASTVTLNAGKNINVGTANTASSIQMNDGSSLALNYGNTKGSAAAKAAANTGIAMGIAVDGSGNPSFNGAVDFDSTGHTFKINGVAYTLVGDAQSLQNLGTYNGVGGASAAAQAKAVQAQLAGHYALIGDIDYSAMTAPIGSAATPFTGVLEGLGHTLDTTVSVFGQVGKTGLVENLGLSASSAVTSGDAAIGALAESNYGKIANVWSTASVSNTDANTGGSGQVGGLVGYNYATGTINNAYVAASVANTNTQGSVGGVAGRNDGTITGASSVANVSGTTMVGGLAGYNQGTIGNAVATGSIIGQAQVGGLVGSNAGGKISGASSIVNVSGDAMVGGLVGLNYGGTISASTSAGTVSGSASFESDLGGLVGDNESTISSAGKLVTAGIITGSHSSATVDAGGSTSSTSSALDGAVGGLVGENGAGASIVNSYATGAVTGYGVKGMGGLVGRNDAASGKVAGGVITSSYATGSVTDNASANVYYEYVGGLVGNNSGTLNQDYATGSVTGSSTAYTGGTDSTGNANSRVGGLVGGNGSAGAINASYATGDVVGDDRVGGLVGGSSGAIVSSYAAGDAGSSTATRVGGLVGGNNGTVSSSYATGDVTGYSQVGGLVGGNSADGTIANTGTLSSVYATGNVAGYDTSSSGGRVGGLVGSNGGAIVNAWAGGNVAGYYRVGGLAGGNNGTVSYAYAIGDVSGVNRVGGLVGGNSADGTLGKTGSISNVYASGTVTDNGTGTSTTDRIGALVGSNGGTKGGATVLPDASMINAVYDSSINPALGAIGYTGTTTYTNGGTSSGTSSNVTAASSSTRYAGSGYAVLGTWTTLAGADGKVRVVKDAKGKPVWVMVEGETRPFLASEWSSNIVNAHQLQLMAMNLAGKYTLANDIDLTALMPTSNASGPASGMWNADEGFAPIGGATYALTAAATGKLTQTMGATPFTGSFDGQGHTITGLTILHKSDVADAIANFDSSTSAARAASATALAYALSRSNFLGLFGVSSGKISNITLDNVTVVGTDAFSTKQVGSYFYEYGGSGAVGSLVGMNKGTITNAHTTSIDGASTVKTDYGAGGLAGVNLGGTIISSDADATTTADGDGAGGLVGANLDGTISASTASGDVATSNGIAGGLVGLNTGTIKSSTASGDVSGKAYLGGLVGINATDAAVSKGTKLAPQTGSTLANLLAGVASLLPPIVKVNGAGTGIIGAGSWATGNVAVANYGYSVGGLVGVNFGTMDSLSSASPTGAISIAGSAVTIGGLVGENYGKISNSSVTGVNINQGSGYIDDLGGLVGYNGGTLLNTYASGTLNGNAWVGGLAAENDGSITGSHFSGTVNGADILGGLVGYSGGTGVITKSYAEGSVSATGTVHSVPHSDGGNSDNQQINRAGGLVGVNDGRISLSYATSDVTADSNDASGTTAQDSVSAVGGLVADNSGTITQSYARNASLTINNNGTNANGWIGGLVGDNGGTISQSYAYTGSMSGGYGSLSTIRGSSGAKVYPMSVTGQGQGGLVGVNWGDSAKKKASIATSFWNTDANSDATGNVSRGIGVNAPDGFSTNDLSTTQGGSQTVASKVKSKGLNTADFATASNFTASGWTVDTTGGGSQAWRLYANDPSGAPLLKALLTKLTVTPVAGTQAYNGGQISVTPAYTYSLSSVNSGDIFNTGGSIALPMNNSTKSGTKAGAYATTGAGLLYSDQQGYDLIFKSGTYTVSKATLDVLGVTVNSKNYNGNTVASLNNSAACVSTNGTSCGGYGSDVVNLVSSKATGTFANKGSSSATTSGIAVTAKGYAISGADAANYTLVQPTGLTGTIN